jgi:hypothetical protein
VLVELLFAEREPLEPRAIALDERLENGDCQSLR